MILGISVDGGHVRGVLMDSKGVVRARAESVQPETRNAIVEVAREILGVPGAGHASASGALEPPAAATPRAPLASANGSSADTLSSVGVSFPDPDPKSWPTDLSSLSAVIGPKVPVRTLSTGNASALAEVLYGVGCGAHDLIAFSIGPCVSAGIISNGGLLAGAHGLASSVQWLALNPVEREDYRRLGCLEAEGGAAGIVRRLIWRVKSGDRSRVVDLVDGDFNAIHLDDILKGARDGDGVSISVIRDTVKYVAMAVSNIAAVMDPDVIILGGVLQSAGDLLLEPIRQECARRMPPSIQERARIELSQLGPDAAPMGAARFAEFGPALP